MCSGCLQLQHERQAAWLGCGGRPLQLSAGSPSYSTSNHSTWCSWASWTACQMTTKVQQQHLTTDWGVLGLGPRWAGVSWYMQWRAAPESVLWGPDLTMKQQPMSWASPCPLGINAVYDKSQLLKEGVVDAIIGQVVWWMPWSGMLMRWNVRWDEMRWMKLDQSH
jgi:hypothetical protein